MYTARTASALDTMPLMACRSPKLHNIRQLANGDGSMYNPPPMYTCMCTGKEELIRGPRTKIQLFLVDWTTSITKIGTR